MQDVMKFFEVDTKKYPLVFNVNVMEAIQNKYGSFKKWGELTDGKKEDGTPKEVDLTALKFGIAEMINEGIDILNDENNTQEPFITDKQAGRIITKLGQQKIAEQVQETVIASTKVESDEKNV